MQHGFVTLNNHHHNSRDLATRRKKSGAIHASLQHMPNKILGRKAAGTRWWWQSELYQQLQQYEMTMKTHRFCKSCCNMLSQIRVVIMAGHNLTAVQRAPQIVRTCKQTNYWLLQTTVRRKWEVSFVNEMPFFQSIKYIYQTPGQTQTV